MDLFKLPNTAKVNRVVPKNAFESYATARQKKLFSKLINRITWLYKLSPETVNLSAGDIKEIQIFKVEVKAKEGLQALLDIIDKSIPYTIIFIMEDGEDICLSTSTKHPNPANENNAVIDWTFKSSWFLRTDNNYSLQLKKSLDAVYNDFCRQLSGARYASKSLDALVQFKREEDQLEREIANLKRSIKNCMQFKIKVGLNLELHQKQLALKKLKPS